MGLIAMTLDRRVRYVLEDDQKRADTEDGYRPTVWLLVPPTPAQLAVYHDTMTMGRMAQAALYLVRECLDGWENLIDPKTGSELRLPDDRDARVAATCDAWRIELAGKIEELGTVPDEDLGGSGSPPT